MKWFFLLVCPLAIFAHAAVTYEFSGGRFGDSLLSYLHAKWLSYQYEIPLLYKPFLYSSELVLDEEEIRYDQVPAFPKELLLNEYLSEPIAKTSYLFICPYFPESKRELKTAKHFFCVDWENRQFRALARALVSPKDASQVIQPPRDKISIAIHVREGGGFDYDQHQLQNPLKFPPLTYFISTLRKVVSLFVGKPIYCHIFTDAHEPREIVEQLKQAMPADVCIDFRVREQDNRHDAHVVEDFFSLFQFDILIRSDSNYSIIPELLSDYAIVCAPLTYTITEDTVTIEEISINIQEALYLNCLQKSM